MERTKVYHAVLKRKVKQRQKLGEVSLRGRVIADLEYVDSIHPARRGGSCRSDKQRIAHSATASQQASPR